MEQSKEEFENSVGEPEKVVSYTLIKIMLKKNGISHLQSSQTNSHENTRFFKVTNSDNLVSSYESYVMNYTLYLQMPLRRWFRDHPTPTPPQQKTFSLPLKFNTWHNKEITKARANAQPQIAT